MKEIIAIIRMNKINITKKALLDIGVNSLTALKVVGRGKAVNVLSVLNEVGDHDEVAGKIEEGLLTGSRLTPRRLLDIVVHDDEVENVVKTIIRTNKENQSGDGKIFILPISEAIRIRTGESGDQAL